MKRLICIVTLLCMACAVQQVVAQPASRREKKENKETGPTLSVRAKTQYTGQTVMPEEVAWKREIYRTIDLKEEKNAALYYPVEPIGDRMNLFSLLFKLMSEGKVPAYEYRLDGTEVMTSQNKINFKDVLDRFHIYYTEKVEGRRDTMLIIDNSDIPSAEVLSYFVKEVSYFDNRSSTYNSKVVAICPVLHRAGDFSTEVTKYPMFWLNYNDLSSYLVRMPVMTSNLNNTSNISLEDYFAKRMFKGDIYKTTNMLNQTLAQYCPNDSAIVKEQKKIEGQLEAFEKNLWVSTRIKPEAPKDSTAAAVANVDKVKEKKAVTSNSKKKGRDNAVSTKSSSASSSSKSAKVKKSSSKSSGSSGPRVSVRRQRR